MTMTFKARVEGIRTNAAQSPCCIVVQSDTPPAKSTHIDASMFLLDGQGMQETPLSFICPEGFAREARVGDVLAGTIYVERPIQ